MARTCFVLAAALCAAPFMIASGALDAPDGSPSQSVRVEIIEGIPDESNWNFTAPAPSETYSESAFGFVAMPTRYSPKGLKEDRHTPFLFRATAPIQLPAGELRLLLRSRTGSRLLVDGQQILSTRFPDLRADGHEEVPELPKAVAPEIRFLRPGHFESLAKFASDGKPHMLVLEAVIGLKDRRPELGELSVSADSGQGFFLLSPTPDARVALTEDGFEEYAALRRNHWKSVDAVTRRKVSAAEDRYWDQRHELARRLNALSEKNSTSSIDAFIDVKLASKGIASAALTDDYSFLRRLTLDTIGVIPTVEQIEAFRNDPRPDKRDRVIDRLLAHPGWADHWVGYWQDVLAENPGILKPMLNNTGPFRWWIYESFADNKPMDRFATELILMEGSVNYGGPAGFKLASGNDVPMAQKAQIIVQSFLGQQMQCARCHDSPNHDFKQKDLFSLAAMLRREPQLVPATSSIPTNSHITINRKVKVTLPPGSTVQPAWPFPSLISEDIPESILRHPDDPRERLAALLTHPRNDRFPKVLVNRLWKRYLGWGLVEPVDDWEGVTPSHPELLDFLARQLVTHDYDLKHVARLIFNSRAYQREVRPDGSQEQPAERRVFASPARRRLNAEELVDSLFFAVGKPVRSEEMNMDVDGRRPVKDFNNLGFPSRAWEFASLSNERDRPALSLPQAQSIVDVLVVFGWRESRQSPRTVRDDEPNIAQPATLANGVFGHGRMARLSDDSEITRLCLDEVSLVDLVRKLYLRILSRPPSLDESEMLVSYLAPGFESRRRREFAGQTHQPSARYRPVSWSNHLNPEATRIKQEQERAARNGDAPTLLLDPAWRERAEDALWALLNSPEFVFVP